MRAKRSARLDMTLRQEVKAELEEEATAQGGCPPTWIANKILEQWAAPRLAAKQFAKEVRGQDDRRE
jgi:hypothetical protein